MPDFQPLARYTRAEILRPLGTLREVGPLVVGRRGAVCFVKPGSRDTFPDRRTVRWAGELPVEVAQGMPVEVFSEAGAYEYLYVGRASLARHGIVPGVPQSVADLRLRHPLARLLWRSMAGIGSLAPEPAAEAAIARLGPDATPDQRLDAALEFVNAWHGVRVASALPPGPGAARILATIDRIAAAAPSAFAHDPPVPPEHRLAVDGRVVFLVESQGTCVWAAEEEGEDPAVWWQGDGRPWVREEGGLTGQLLHVLVREAARGATFGAAAAGVGADVVERLCARMAPLPIPPSRWPGWPARAYARSGALAIVCPHQDVHRVWIGARHPAVLDFCGDLVDAAWDRDAF
ncbi:MAG: hypothetical protein ACOZNI_03440 [Myxococcota bacterium]